MALQERLISRAATADSNVDHPHNVDGSGKCIVCGYGLAAIGKGTQARLLERKYPGKVKVLGTGDIFRGLGNPDNPLNGVYAEEVEGIRRHMAAGELVPDELVMPIVAGETQRLFDEGAEVVFYDGAVRTLPQLRYLEESILPGLGGDTNVVHVLFDGKVETSRKRLLNRIQQAQAAGGEVRSDDENREAAEVRVREYKEKTHPVVLELNRREALSVVDAEQPIEDVFNDFERVVLANSSLRMPASEEKSGNHFSSTI